MFISIRSQKDGKIGTWTVSKSQIFLGTTYLQLFVQDSIIRPCLVSSDLLYMYMIIYHVYT